MVCYQSRATLETALTLNDVLAAWQLFFTDPLHVESEKWVEFWKCFMSFSTSCLFLWYWQVWLKRLVCGQGFLSLDNLQCLSVVTYQFYLNCKASTQFFEWETCILLISHQCPFRHGLNDPFKSNYTGTIILYEPVCLGSAHRLSENNRWVTWYWARLK